MVLATASSSMDRAAAPSGAADGRAPAAGDPVTGAAQREATAPGARATPIKLIILCGALLIAALSIGTAWFVLDTRARAIADTERELGNVVLVLTEEIDRSFQSLALVQTSVIEGMQSLGLRSSAEFEHQMSGRDVHEM